MKSFLEHLNENVLPSVQVADGGLDIDKPAVRSAINAAIASVVSQTAVTPYVVYNRLSKLLAQYHINLPRKFLEGDKGVEVFELRQFGSRMGMTDTGEFVKEVPATYYLFLQYHVTTPFGVTYATPTVGGNYQVSARIVDKVELDRLLDVAEISLREDAECRQKTAKALAPRDDMHDITSDEKKVGNKKAVATSEKGLSEQRHKELKDRYYGGKELNDKEMDELRGYENKPKKEKQAWRVTSGPTPKRNPRVFREESLNEGRPSQRHPLEGHPYHKKSHAELEYIGRDAHAAAQAMKNHNPAAEAKYLDQANDAATVRHFRKTSGNPEWYRKKYGLKEETLDETRILRPVNDKDDHQPTPAYAKRMEDEKNKRARRKIDKANDVHARMYMKTGDKKWLHGMKEETLDEALSHGARELTLYADNHEGLHRQSHQPIVKNLERKHKKGTYDHEKAKKLWGYHAKRASDAYHKEFGHKFSKSERDEAAAHFADSARDEHGFGTVKEEKKNLGRLDETSKERLADYIPAAAHSIAKTSAARAAKVARDINHYGSPEYEKDFAKQQRRHTAIRKAADRLAVAKEETIEEHYGKGDIEKIASAHFKKAMASRDKVADSDNPHITAHERAGVLKNMRDSSNRGAYKGMAKVARDQQKSREMKEEKGDRLTAQTWNNPTGADKTGASENDRGITFARQGDQKGDDAKLNTLPAGGSGGKFTNRAPTDDEQRKQDSSTTPGNPEAERNTDLDSPTRTRTVRESAPPGAKYERMVNHIKDNYAKDGKLTKSEKAKAFATAWKAKNREG